MEDSDDKIIEVSDSEEDSEEEEVVELSDSEEEELENMLMKGIDDEIIVLGINMKELINEEEPCQVEHKGTNLATEEAGTIDDVAWEKQTLNDAHHKARDEVEVV